MAATPTNLLLLTWYFSLSRVGTDEDIAEFSIATHQDSYEADQDGLNAITAGAFAAWKSNMPSQYWATNVYLSQTIGTQYQANGDTLRKAVFVPGPDAGDHWVGSDSGSALPWETALACSLYTYPRGSFQPNARRHRGRFYMPPMAASTLDSSNSGYFKNANLATLLGHLADFVQDVGQDGLGVRHTRAGVWSRADNVVRDVVQLSIDAKFDSQRRRQNREVAGHIEIGVS